MPDVKVHTLTGDGGTMSLGGSLFECKPSYDAIHRYVKVYLFNQMEGNAQTKTRSLVSGGRKKPFKQKGTGRARAGTTRSPLWRGGGRTHGTVPRDPRRNLPIAMRRRAFASAMTVRCAEGNVALLDIMSPAVPSTKPHFQMLQRIGWPQERTHVLVITDNAQPNLYKSLRNIAHVIVKPVGEVNAYNLVRSQHILIQKSALTRLQEVYV